MKVNLFSISFPLGHGLGLQQVQRVAAVVLQADQVLLVANLG
jgi:hypothetical protein